MNGFYDELARDAAGRYGARDRYGRHFASGKLRHDPVFRHLLAHGVLAHATRVLDLGCGQGVLGALLITARERKDAGEWPAAWPAPPRLTKLRGIDLLQKDIERARRASGNAAEFVCGDIQHTAFDAADAVVILDVLHYVDFAAQQDVLERVRNALGTTGVLILRVADRSPTLRFRYTLAVDMVVTRCRGHRADRLYCKPVTAWREQLESLGFEVRVTPMGDGTFFANVLLEAHVHPTRADESTLLP